MKAKVPTLAEFATTYRPHPGPQCVTCESPHAKAIDEWAEKTAREGGKVRPAIVLNWLRSIGAEPSHSSVSKHLRDKHWTAEWKKKHPRVSA